MTDIKSKDNDYKREENERMQKTREVKKGCRKQGMIRNEHNFFWVRSSAYLRPHSPYLGTYAAERNQVIRHWLRACELVHDKRVESQVGIT